MIFNSAQQQAEGSVIIAANPGFYELRLTISGKPKSMPVIVGESIKVPILAWRIIGDTREAITPDNPPLASDETRSLLLPSGAIIGTDGTYYKDAEAWSAQIFATWRARWTEQQQKQAVA